MLFLALAVLGLVWSNNRKTVSPVTKTCPTGYTWDTALQVCRQDAGGDEITCPAGYHFDASFGVCVQDSADCPDGFHMSGGVCVRDIVTGTCDPGFTWDPELEACVRDVLPACVATDDADVTCDVRLDGARRYDTVVSVFGLVADTDRFLKDGFAAAPSNFNTTRKALDWAISRLYGTALVRLTYPPAGNPGPFVTYRPGLGG